MSPQPSPRFLPNERRARVVAELGSIAHIISLAIQNATHYHQVREQAMHLAYLNEVGSALTSTLDLPDVLHVIIDGVNAQLETERTSVFLIDSNTGELVLSYGTEGGTDIRLAPPWGGIAGWVATHDQPALVNDTLSDPRHLRQIAIETGYEAQSILCVPLRIEDEVIGVVEVLNKTENRQFTRQDQGTLIGLTQWASIAIHNARLFDERVRAYQRLAGEQERRIAAETRGAMAAVVLEMAHTMNNVVGAIKVWAAALDKTSRAAAQTPLENVSEKIRQIRNNAEEAIELISKIKAPLEEATLAPTDIHHYLDKAIRNCYWPIDIQLQQRYDPNLPPINADAHRLQTVFQNLLLNAVQALTPGGGEIRVSTRLVILDLKLQEHELPTHSNEGWLLLDYLVEARPKTKVIILSGKAGPGDVANLLTNYPILAFVEKRRFDPQAIKDAIAQATRAPELRLQTLGQFRLWRDSQAIDRWDRPQAETVIKLLLTRRAEGGRAVSADELITRLWPDSDEAGGRKRLLPLISNARRTLEPDIEPRDSNFIVRGSTGYFFDLGSNVQWDLVDFRQYLAQGRQQARSQQWEAASQVLRKGRDLYRGEFLSEDRYADWAMAIRREVAIDFRDLLLLLADAYARLKRYAEAIDACEAALCKDPLLESTYRRLMRFHYCHGEKGQALKVYRNCLKIFEEMFGESPTPVTRRLQQAIAADERIDCFPDQ